MTDEPGNLTLRLLQELRADMGELRAEMREVRTEMQDMRADLTRRVDGNTLLLNMLGGVAHDYEERITKLEAR